MALHFNGRDADGTYRISASSGHGKTTEGKRDYPFHIKGKQPISIDVDLSDGKNDYIGQNKFYINGDIEATDLNTIAVYRNGLSLKEGHDYYLDLQKREIILTSPVVPTDDWLELRAAQWYGNHTNTTYVDDVLILKASKDVQADLLSILHPKVAEKVNRNRLMKYEENKEKLEDIHERFGIFEIVHYRVEPDGIYATLKIY